MKLDLQTIIDNIMNIPSVVKVNIPEPPKEYEAFIYRWTNKSKNGKKYLGSHKGFVGDGYLDSSSNKDFKQDRADSSQEFIYEILEYGDYYEIVNRENKILLKADAENNDEYYNEHNGGTKAESYDMDKIMEFVNRVNSGEFDCDVLEDKEEVYNLRRLQSRTEWYVSETVSIVKSGLKDSAGCVDNCNPIIICEERIKNTKGGFDDVIIDGNNTITGIYQSQHATEAPVARIPKKIHEKLSNIELNAASNLFNKRPVVSKKPASLKDAAKHLLKTYVNTNGKIKPEHPTNNRWMSEMNYNNDQKRSIRKYAEKDIKQYKFELANKVFISYDTNSPYRNELVTKTETLRDKDTHAVYRVSDYIRMDRVMTEFRISGKRNLKVVIYHKDVDDAENWSTKMKAEHQLEVDHWVLTHKDVDSFEWVEMPYEKDNDLI